MDIKAGRFIANVSATAKGSTGWTAWPGTQQKTWLKYSCLRGLSVDRFLFSGVLNHPSGWNRSWYKTLPKLGMVQAWKTYDEAFLGGKMFNKHIERWKWQRRVQVELREPKAESAWPTPWGGGYLGHFWLDICHCTLIRTPTPFCSILWPSMDPILVPNLGKCNFRHSNLVTFWHFYNLESSYFKVGSIVAVSRVRSLILPGLFRGNESELILTKLKSPLTRIFLSQSIIPNM